MSFLSRNSLHRSTIQGQNGEIPLGPGWDGVTLNITSASVSDEGILKFSWTPLSTDYSHYLAFDLVIMSGFTNGTGFSSTFPGPNVFSDEAANIFDEPRKRIQNIYSWKPQDTINKWRSSAAPGNPYDSRIPQDIILGQGTTGCSGYNTTYSNLRAYGGMTQWYPEQGSVIDPTTNAYNYATLDLKLIQNDPIRAALLSWRNDSKLVRGNAQLLIRPWSGHGFKSPLFGRSRYNFGNWSFYNVTLPSNAIFPALKAGGQNTNYRLEGRTVKWDLDSCNTNFYMYLYKNGSVLRNGYLGNDGNPNAINGAGDLAYTIPAADGAGSYQLYIANYYPSTNSFGAYTSFSFSL
jgi:hypothetical protein